MKYGLPDRTLADLNAIFHRYPGITQAVLYGSRAKGKYRNGSDIDLTLKTGNSITRSDLLHIAGDCYAKGPYPRTRLRGGVLGHY
jgi:predicted nucleotidyltransferase